MIIEVLHIRASTGIAVVSRPGTIFRWHGAATAKAYSRKSNRSGRVMKLITVQSLAITALLFASPALAQTNDQAVNEGAGVIAWIVVGLIGGYLASRMVNKTGEGVVRDIILGIVGGIVGGVIFACLAATASPDSTSGASWSRSSAVSWCC